MSKITDLQEEFEVLIKELERLKSINEITSINSLNAEMTIDELKKFIDVTEKFISAIKSDYNEKMKSFSEREKALNDAIIKLHQGIEDQSKKFELITSINSKSWSNDLDLLKKDWNSRIENYMHQIKDVRKKIETEVLEYSRNTAGTLRTQNSMVVEQIENESKTKTRELNLLRLKQEESVDLIKAEYLRGIKELKSEFITKNDQLKIEISNNADKIETVMYLVIGFGSIISIGLLALIISN
ncbi:hypothetical protein [Algoriphagus sanaruensis]|uniref:Uncharacterized protein n=1 Tax=Algoriphagus sanaruensis TaxID=1727163 RepID=A0A142EPM2_9BACT|nr:hypothetical protein [Algoriphagus sanaruensis]AMQ57077.1 hypothetical protein AO498_11575 [Algoriphagus sanaruensis]